MSPKMLKRYIELGEQIRKLCAEQDEIKELIKTEFGGEPGRSISCGIAYSVETRVRINLDGTALKRVLGDNLKKYQYETVYHVVTVKPTSQALFDSLWGAES